MNTLDDIIRHWNEFNTTEIDKEQIIVLNNFIQLNGLTNAKSYEIKRVLKNATNFLEQNRKEITNPIIEVLYNAHTQGFNSIELKKQEHIDWFSKQIMLAHIYAHKAQLAGIRARKTEDNQNEQIEWFKQAIEDNQQAIHLMTNKDMKLREEDYSFIVINNRLQSIGAGILARKTSFDQKWLRMETEALYQAGMYQLFIDPEKGENRISFAYKKAKTAHLKADNSVDKLFWAEKAFEIGETHAGLAEARDENTEITKRYSTTKWFIFKLLDLTNYDQKWLDKGETIGQKLLDYARLSQERNRLSEAYSTLGRIYKRKLHLEEKNNKLQSTLNQEQKKEIALKLYKIQKEESEFRDIYQEGDVAKSFEDLATTAYQIYRITENTNWYIQSLNAAKKAFRLMKHTNLHEAIDLYLRVAKTGGIIIQREKKHLSPVIKLCDELIDILETNPEAKKHPNYFDIKKKVYSYRGEAARKLGSKYYGTIRVKKGRKKRHT